MSDFAGFVQFFGFGIHDTAHPLAAHLKQGTRLLLHPHQFASLRQLVHQRLFTVNRLARAHGIYGDSVVPVVGSTHYNGVYIRPDEQFAIILCGKQLLAVQFLCPLEPACVQIADGRQLQTGQLQKSTGISDTYDSHSHDPYSYFVVGRISLAAL